MNSHVEKWLLQFRFFNTFKSSNTFWGFSGKANKYHSVRYGYGTQTMGLVQSLFQRSIVSDYLWSFGERASFKEYWTAYLYQRNTTSKGYYFFFYQTLIMRVKLKNSKLSFDIFHAKHLRRWIRCILLKKKFLKYFGHGLHDCTK